MSRASWQSGLNAIALLGWGGVLCNVATGWATLSIAPGTWLFRTTLCLECVCWFEVVQILTGAAKGNAALGVSIHVARSIVLLVVFPTVPTATAAKLSLLAWVLTEVMRYPMFLAPHSKILRNLRYFTPLLTFPLGAFSEAAACYTALPLLTSPIKYIAGVVVPYNTIGFFAGYGVMLKKALETLKPRKPVD